MRKDDQHSRPRVKFLGLPIYPGSHSMCNPEYFVDMCNATARMVCRHKPELRKTKTGGSTGGVWLCLWAWDNIPEPYRTEIAQEYLQVRLEKQEERARRTRERNAAEPPAP